MQERFVVTLLVGHAVQSIHVPPHPRPHPFWQRQAAILLATALQIMHLLRWGDTPLQACELLPLLVIVGGVFLRASAYRELGKLYTFLPEIQERHWLVTTGPYAWTSHPGYLAQFTVLLGALAFYYPPWCIGVLIVVYLVRAGYHRIRMEERMLLEKFGADYIKYKNSVLF